MQWLARLPIARGDAGLAIAEQAKRIARVEAEGSIERVFAEAPACADAMGSLVGSSSSTASSLPLVFQTGSSVLSSVGPRLRMRARGRAKGEQQGKWQLEQARFHGVIATGSVPGKFLALWACDYSEFMLL